MNVLVTGGAGFIGTHLTRRLLREGCNVSVLDKFSSQVHVGAQDLPADLIGQVRLFRGDVRDQNVLGHALEKQDVVVHLAAETGTGQSMYEISRYQEINIGGTAAILDFLINHPTTLVSRIVLASSRAVYGEGKYRCAEHGSVYPGSRLLQDLKAGRYEPRCPACRATCIPEATTEDSVLHPLSFYGLTKQVQEQMILMLARIGRFSAYVLRYQNVYGPGQSLHNPYTGILAIFANLARANSPMQVFEDGRESRDFVYVDDVVEATWRCVRREGTSVESVNVGTGQRTTVLQVADEIVRFFGSNSKVSVTGAFRRGDIRHNFAAITKISELVGFAPQFTLRDGLKRFLDWVDAQVPVPGEYESSLDEMRQRGLLHG
jgi:dTDP-L-rhamnose 4-epimerase